MENPRGKETKTDGNFWVSNRREKFGGGIPLTFSLSLPNFITNWWCIFRTNNS